MTAPDQKEEVAAVGFVGFMTMALGPLGFLIAAVSVGIERMWNGGAQERDRARERGRGWLGEKRDWLAADHRRREDRRRKRRNWLTAGADPSTEPAEPRRGRRLRDGIRRAIARAAIAVADFAAGARDGWQAAQKVRKNGGSLRDIATARPEVCGLCRRPRVPVVDNGLCADCVRAEDAQWQRPDEDGPTGPRPIDHPERLRNVEYNCPACGDSRDGYQSEEEAYAALKRHRDADCTGPTRETPAGQPPVNPMGLDDGTPHQYEDEGDNMAESTQSQTSAAPSNASVLQDKLIEVRAQVTKQVDAIDGAAIAAKEIAQKATAAADLATLTDQAAVTIGLIAAVNQAAALTGAAAAEASTDLANLENLLRDAIDAQGVIQTAENDLAAVGAGASAIAETPN